MPMQSQAQRRWMWATHPAMAKRWEAETPSGPLPSRVSTQALRRAALLRKMKKG